MHISSLQIHTLLASEVRLRRLMGCSVDTFANKLFSASQVKTRMLKRKFIIISNLGKTLVTYNFRLTIERSMKQLNFAYDVFELQFKSTYIRKGRNIWT